MVKGMDNDFKTNKSAVVKIGMYVVMALLAVGRIGASESEGIVIMRMSYREYQRTNTVIQQQNENNISEDIGKYLRPYYRVFIDSTLSANRDTGVTRADAEAAVSNYPANFVLYGTITNESQYLQARFELYDKRNNRVEYFYGSDGIREYERLIRTISENILSWFQTKTDKVEELRSDITAMRQELEEMKREQGKGEELNSEVERMAEELERMKREEEEREELNSEVRAIREELEEMKREEEEGKEEAEYEKEITVRIPVRVGYWSYTESEWVERIQGTVEANVGVEFIPELQFRPILGMRNELSIDIFMGYRYGLNVSNSDQQQVHSIIVNSGITYHVNVYSNNWILMGAGLVYEMGMWHVEESEYGMISDYRQSLTGMSVMVGYRYRLSNRLSVDLGANMYIYFVEGASTVIRPYMGLSATLTGGKYDGIER